MAKFLLMTGPYAGHVAPFVPIARRLVQRRHEVVWIAGRQYKTRVESTGARFHPIPKDWDPDGMELHDFYPDLKGMKGLAQMKHMLKYVHLDSCAADIGSIDSALADFPADVFVGDPTVFGLIFESEMAGMPFACLSLLPLSIPSRDTPPFGLGLLPGENLVAKARNRLLNFLTERVLLRDVTAHANRVRQQLGLARLHGPFLRGMYEKASLVMQISTAAFEYPRSDQPESVHFIGPIVPEPVGAFQPPPWWSALNGAAPVVLVNQGTIAIDLNDLVVPTIKALKDQTMFVVAVPVNEGALGGLPDHVRAEPFVPFDRLLPHVDIMVTNGGYGGTQLALAHGVPLVIAGGTEDKREVAARVEWSGAGINLRKQRPSPNAIREAILEVLSNPIYRENAKRIQADFAKYCADAGGGAS